MAGLGNPGAKYDRTRHNAGFIVLDELARRFGVEWKKRDGAQLAHVVAHAVVLVKPLSFMNDSGIPLQRLAAWWKTPPADLLVVSDDLDLPFGRLRMRASGGSGGHNGLKSVIAHFGEAFPRLRVGIGRGGAAAADAEGERRMPDTIDFVLSKFTGAEMAALATIADAAADGARRWLDEGPVPAMNVVNAWRAPEKG